MERSWPGQEKGLTRPVTSLAELTFVLHENCSPHLVHNQSMKAGFLMLQCSWDETNEHSTDKFSQAVELALLNRNNKYYTFHFGKMN